MKLAILTTETTHHSYFVKEISKQIKEIRIFVEKSKIKPLFNTSHSFERERRKYELETCFPDGKPFLKNYGETSFFDNINDMQLVDSISIYKPNVVLVFGTSKIKERIIKLYNNKILNLHGGNPEEYRGLDSHLWSIYHKDFDNLVSCLHKVSVGLDEGDIVKQEKININKNMQIKELRKKTTEVNIKISLEALREYEKEGTFSSRPQKKIGRYYSFMPGVLKEKCRLNFEKFSKKI